MMGHFCHKLLHIIRLQRFTGVGSAPDTYSQRRSEPAVKLSASESQGPGGRENLSSIQAEQTGRWWIMVAYANWSPGL